MKLEASILQQRMLQQIPSASGIEYVEGSYYVLGDDSPYLYQLGEAFELKRKYPLFDTTAFKNGRIPKAEKPDLESMAHFTYGRDNMLLLLGSGSSESRNKAYWVNLSENMKVREVDFSRFFTFLKSILKIKTEGELNIEGLATDEIYTYLLHRSIGNKANVLFRFDTGDFKDYILGNAGLPAAAAYYFMLPAVGQNGAGFSGAYTSEGKLFVTASVEATSNAIDDGEVLGSFIGVIDLLALPYASDAANPLQVPAVQLTNTNGSVYKGKAESLIVTMPENQNKYKAIIVTDDDKGGSELLEVELTVE
ncbi:hypothetical protein [uncultured Pontibacter sp.]|uniref:DUF6929 family protein n=1 Tax=uncultured Pontibacter sp. TaxID=453356 RepID=UPI002607F9EF|nr:hypothetical protein [uncultured Pontibacter sp.]